jgi:trimethylamine--corrinoid protein Co-methyltransferase
MATEISEKLSQREGVLVDPYERLMLHQIEAIHRASLEILENIGFVCSNARATELFAENGARLSTEDGTTMVKLPKRLIEHCVETAPSKVVLGARNPDNCLILDAYEPRVRFGTGSETNIWLDIEWGNGSGQNEPTGTKPSTYHPTFMKKRGTIDLLCKSARLCEHLDAVDFFIRNVNIQDPSITDDKKDGS